MSYLYEGDLDQETADWLQAELFDATMAELRANKAARIVNNRNQHAGIHLLKTRWGLVSAMLFGTSQNVETLFRELSKVADAVSSFCDDVTKSHALGGPFFELSSWLHGHACRISGDRVLKAYRVVSVADQNEAETLNKKAEEALQSLHAAVYEWMKGRGLDPNREGYRTNVCHALQKIERLHPEI